MVARRIAWIAAALLAAGPAMADFKPDPNALVKDLEMTNHADDRLTIVLWLPTEFWRSSLENAGKLAPKEIERFVKELDPYVVVAVADGTSGIAGSVTFADPDVLKSSMTIEDARGNLLSALPDNDVSPGVRNLVQIMRPMFGNMLGSLGSHLAVVVFKGADKAGHRTVEPTRDGKFVVHVGTLTLQYRLPLASLLPPAIDPGTGESFPGNYHFNPFTGGKLAPAPADPPKPPGEPPPAVAPGAPKSP
jgi:hypothetical protein